MPNPSGNKASFSLNDTLIGPYSPVGWRDIGGEKVGPLGIPMIFGRLNVVRFSESNLS